MSHSSVLFTTDGIPADLVRAGEPRLRRTRRSAVRAESTSPVRQPLTRLAHRLLPS